MNHRLSLLAAVGILAFAANASAQTVQVAANGTLTDSTNTSTVFNVLDLTSGTTGFNFSGTTGSFALPTSGGAFSSPSGASKGGYYYADYLITVTGSTAESVTTSLDNTTGVGKLSERIYTYSNTAGTNGFLGDTSFSSAGVQGIEVWSTNIPGPGVAVSIISPSDLTAGSYVVELRGTNAGNFGGTLSLTPVPEPETYAMLLGGLVLVGLVVYRRKNKFRADDLLGSSSLNFA